MRTTIMALGAALLVSGFALAQQQQARPQQSDANQPNPPQCWDTHTNQPRNVTAASFGYPAAGLNNRVREPAPIRRPNAAEPIEPCDSASGNGGLPIVFYPARLRRAAAIVLCGRHDVVRRCRTKCRSRRSLNLRGLCRYALAKRCRRATTRRAF